MLWRFVNQGWVGAVIGLIGILAAVVMFRLSRRQALAAFQIRSLRLLGHEPEKLPQDVEVRFQGKRVPRLTKSFIVFWNAGQATITGQDVVASDPLRVLCEEDAEVLSATSARVTRPVINFQAHPSTHGANVTLLTFDFLDPGDGAVVEVLHTGSARASIAGTIKGIPAGPIYFGPLLGGHAMLRFPSWLTAPRLARAVLVAGLGVTLLGAVTSIWPVLGIGLLYAAQGGLMWWLVRRRYPAALRIEEIE